MLHRGYWKKSLEPTFNKEVITFTTPIVKVV